MSPAPAAAAPTTPTSTIVRSSHHGLRATRRARDANRRAAEAAVAKVAAMLEESEREAARAAEHAAEHAAHPGKCTHIVATGAFGPTSFMEQLAGNHVVPIVSEILEEPQHDTYPYVLPRSRLCMIPTGTQPRDQPCYCCELTSHPVMPTELGDLSPLLTLSALGITQCNLLGNFRLPPNLRELVLQDTRIPNLYPILEAAATSCIKKLAFHYAKDTPSPMDDPTIQTLVAKISSLQSVVCTSVPVNSS
jgi:hypothetical protein